MISMISKIFRLEIITHLFLGGNAQCVIGWNNETAL